ncbi:MAG: ROK family protein [Bacteroidota bacterium]
MNPGISATHIKSKTKLQMSTVLYTLKVLKDKGYVKEIGYGNSTVQGGKPPVLWDLVNEYGLIFGIELLSTEARLVLINFKGEIQYKNIFPISVSKDPYEIATQIKNIVSTVQNEHNVLDDNILGLGIGIPGTIDNEKGIINYSYSFDFHNINFRSILNDIFNFDVEIDNDANVGVLGVKWLNSQEFLTSNILYLSINQNFSGIGAGLLIDHKIYRGSNSAAGEVSTSIAKSAWKRILNNALKKFGDECLFCQSLSNNKIMNIKEIIEHAKVGEQSSIYILREVAKELSKKIIDLVDLLNPAVVMIGGSICDGEEFIKPIIEERVKNKVISEVVNNTPIRFSSFGEYSGAVGGSALFLKKYFMDQPL